jgi:hypothetical protein
MDSSLDANVQPAVTLVFVVAGSAQSQNVLTNGGFETGDFTGWTLGKQFDGDNRCSVLQGITSAPEDVNSGSYAAYMNTDCVTIFSQTLSTVVGQQYEITFSAFATHPLNETRVWFNDSSEPFTDTPRHIIRQSRILAIERSAFL